MLGDAMALGAALCWSAALLIFRRLSGEHPAALNLFKNVFASGLLVATMGLLSIPFDLSRSPSEFAMLIASGVLGLAVADTLFLAGLSRAGASVAAVADCAYAPSVILLSVAFLGEPLTLGLSLGAPLVVLGLLIVGWEARSPARFDRLGFLLVVVSVVMTALSLVLAKRVLDQSDLIEATAFRLIVGSLALFLFCWARGEPRQALALLRPQAAWRFAIPAAFLGSYLAMMLWLGGAKYGMASRTALINQSAAIFVLLACRFIGEPVTRRRWAGAAVALTGVSMVFLLR